MKNVLSGHMSVRKDTFHAGSRLWRPAVPLFSKKPEWFCGESKTSFNQGRFLIQ
jgi:hypothetical protein